MDKRHLLEEGHQRQALKEFNNLQRLLSTPHYAYIFKQL